jgi:hypothetical protein
MFEENGDNYFPCSISTKKRWNYWWYTECVKLHIVLRQLKSLRTPVLDKGRELLRFSPYKIHISAQLTYNQKK